MYRTKKTLILLTDRDKFMKVGLIGAGHIATVHAPIIQQREGADLVGIADMDLTRAKTLAQNYPGCASYGDAVQLIEEQRPDVVHILTSPGSHAALAIMAMERGCHVFVEKPMALDLESAKSMLDAAAQHNVKLCVNHNMLFEGVVSRAREIEQAGNIGDVVSVEVSYQFDPRRYPAILEEGAQYSHWTYQLNGGPLQDLLPHAASLVGEYLDEIESIQHVGLNRGVLPQPYQDEIRVLVSSKSCTGTMSVSLSEKPDIILLTLKGTRGIIHADLYNDVVVVRKKSILPRFAARALSGFSLAGQNLKGALRNLYVFGLGKIDKSNGVGPLINKYYDAIAQGNASPIGVDKSCHVVKIMETLWPEPQVQAAAVPPPPTTATKDAECLVTGASGFIGVHLIKKLLAEGKSVRAVVRPNSHNRGRLQHLGVDIVEGDLGDRQILETATQGIETVFHAGSPMTNDWQEFTRVAVDGTQQLLDICCKNGTKKFVQFSSLAVYELLKIQEKVITESSQQQLDPKKMGPYAWAKMETEKMAMAAHRNHGLDVSIVRPGMVIGPLGRIFFPHLGYNLQESVFLVIGNGKLVLPFTYVENTVDAIYLTSVKKEAAGQAYNIIDDGNVTANDYLNPFLQTTRIDGKIIHLPYLLPWSATLAYEIVSSMGLIKKGATSRAQLGWKQAKVTFSNRKLKEELQWNMPVSLDEGMRRTFQWYADKYC